MQQYNGPPQEVSYLSPSAFKRMGPTYQLMSADDSLTYTALASRPGQVRVFVQVIVLVF